jgi:hypothetical protein
MWGKKMKPLMNANAHEFGTKQQRTEITERKMPVNSYMRIMAARRKAEA